MITVIISAIEFGDYPMIFVQMSILHIMNLVHSAGRLEQTRRDTISSQISGTVRTPTLRRED